jgi:hypothetical protein
MMAYYFIRLTGEYYYLSLQKQKTLWHGSTPQPSNERSSNTMDENMKHHDMYVERVRVICLFLFIISAY